MQKENNSKNRLLKRAEQKFKEDTVKALLEDFENRRKSRLKYERQWLLNMNFLRGNQYSFIARNGEIFEEDKDFFWEDRRVYNHIAPIIDSRLARFSRINPTVSVRPVSDDDDDVIGADKAEKLIAEAFRVADIKSVVKTVTEWSESCGTGFYKVVWKDDSGDKIGVVDRNPVFNGDVEISAVSPFEIFPDSLYVQNISDCKSIIHAKAMDVDAVYEKYGVKLTGEKISVYGLSPSNSGANSSEEQTLSNAVIVIEKYEAPSSLYKNGRLITVAGNTLLYYGDLPYFNGEKNSIIFPFVKQSSCECVGEFFGTSIIERMIPVQRAYNAVKNRKHEFLNRLSTGIINVEDGSLDVEDLSEEGLAPGKIIVYRQGSSAPKMLENAEMPQDFNKEEDKLLNEFVIISGVSDVLSSNANASVSSGTALKILIEQDNERLITPAEEIRNSFVSLAKLVIKLYAEYLNGVRAVKSIGEDGKTQVLYVDKTAVRSFDCYLDSENELLYTEEQKKNEILNLYNSGLLSGDDGIVPVSVKEKVLSALGYKDLDAAKGTVRLQEEKAKSENEKIRNATLDIDEIDDDEIHVFEHTRYVLSEYDELSPDQKQRLFDHVSAHKRRLSISKNDIKEKINEL